ncbi:hypothetical protein niasHT_006243 [Heterodera trifolii]|uniref:Uncharacterized protein n=1 Tax=Heterodera trifolii TaxID=157864 RepID=A0ABD2M1U6_9BILA
MNERVRAVTAATKQRKRKEKKGEKKEGKEGNTKEKKRGQRERERKVTAKQTAKRGREKQTHAKQTQKTRPRAPFSVLCPLLVASRATAAADCPFRHPRPRRGCSQRLISDGTCAFVVHSYGRI